jgi:nitroimidazol reductase NimA-like FMN-containing flavoprotein (pyridoxamine 5'-phosphate oxidase superfamily)
VVFAPVTFSCAAFNHNVNFRSVMAFGKAGFCAEDVKQTALQTFVDRLAPGICEYARKPTEQEGNQSHTHEAR